MTENEQLPPLGRRILLISLVCILVYWFASAILWIPWVVAEWLGMTAMVILAPFLFGAGAFYCLKHAPVRTWKKEMWLIAGIFLVICALLDYLFWIVWRGIPMSDLYHPTTFAAYGLVVIIAPIVRVIATRSPQLLQVDMTTKYDEIIVAILAVTFFLLTLYSVRFW